MSYYETELDCDWSIRWFDPYSRCIAVTSTIDSSKIYYWPIKFSLFHSGIYSKNFPKISGQFLWGTKILNRKKHFEKINAIYHPATYSPERFDADLIWLASDDFSVSVWSLSLRCALISFFNHSAPVQRFGICPLRNSFCINCKLFWENLKINTYRFCKTFEKFWSGIWYSLFRRFWWRVLSIFRKRSTLFTFRSWKWLSRDRYSMDTGWFPLFITEFDSECVWCVCNDAWTSIEWFRSIWNISSSINKLSWSATNE